jgi:hypothetical protein
VNLVQLVRSGRVAEERYSLEQYIADATTAGLTGGITQTYMPDPQGRRTETSESPFEHWVGSAYKRNGVVFACQVARLLLFSEARFQFQRMREGRPGDLFGTRELALLEDPWPNGSTGELLARMIQDADLAGNAYLRRTAPTSSVLRLERLRPDWVAIVLGANPDLLVPEVVGYLYYEGGIMQGKDPVVLARDEVAHWSPIPDPAAAYRGMSWLTPVLREIRSDTAATNHKQRFFENGATPNMVIKFDPKVAADALERFKEIFNAEHRGASNAYKTLFLGGGADATVVGNDFKQMDFRNVQGAGETRVATAAGVPPVIVGLSEGLQAATYCLPGDELVWTVGGPKPIADVAVGDMVWSHVDDGVAPRRVTWWGRTGEKQVFTIRTKNRTFRATGNHPVLVRTPGSMVSGANAERHPGTTWRTVGELQPGDCVVQVMDTPDVFSGSHLPTGAEATTEVMQWLGAYVGDGSGAGSGSVSLALPPTDRARDHYEKLTSRLFPDVHLGYDKRSFRFCSVSVGRWLADIGFAGRATTKRIPPWVFTLRRNLRMAFLAGLVDTDGSVDKRGTLKIQLANRFLVEQVKMLAISCGLQASNLYEQSYSPDVLPNPGKQEFYVSWAVTVSSAADVAQIPFVDWLYRQRVEENAERRRRGGRDAAKAGLDPDVLGFFTIRSIEPGPVVPVFDVTVDEGASFVAGGVVVHNSNYAQARRRFADMTIRPLWRSCCAALATVVRVPTSTRLWYDDRDVPALQEDEKDAASIEQVKASTIASLVREGFTAESAVAAVMAQDMRLLEHTGRLSVQLKGADDGTPDDTEGVNE